ncbi:NADH-quinone oxidoreductase subunit NuoG [Halomonas sp. WWR20]
MATIHVDGNAYQVDGADNLLHACLSLGLDIPYFCWHPAMGSVGACRQCAVKQYKDADDTKGMLVMSCMAPVKDDSYISIEDGEAKAFRASVIEWLMINHPHDCPVCEEGGHCHLQDMTVMTGHDRRRYRFRKRTHKNQYLGPFVAHEMNRCITCYRCVRFYKDYAGGEDLGVFGAHDNIYFGRYQEGVLESEFSGNLTEVCPTGVFTDQTHSDHYTRKWDLQFAPSICHQCAVGCNTSPGERYGDIRRIENRYHGEVNHYFLCDRGRFGYGYVNRDDRPRRPEYHEHTASRSQAPHHLEIDAALDRAADMLRNVPRIVGIGSPRASLESNHLLRELVGEDNFSTGINAAEQHCLELMQRLAFESGAATPSLREIEAHDVVLILGEDVMQTAARLALAVRQAVLARRDALAEARGIPVWNAEAVKTLAQDERNPLFIATPAATRLDGLAEEALRAAPEDIARLGFAVAHAIDDHAPPVADLDAATRERAEHIAEVLLAAKRPLIVSGGSLGSAAVLEAAGNVARALSRRTRQASLSLVRREANSTGLAMLGGRSLEAALEALDENTALVILENDLHHRLGYTRAEAALSRAAHVVVIDHQRTPTWARAELGLPAATFAEGDGTLVSLEGRAQRFYQVFETSYTRPESRIRESWRWLHALQATLARSAVAPVTLDDVTHALSQRSPLLAGVVQAAPGADFRVRGLKLAREPHRYSGRTAMRAHLDVNEPRAPVDPDTPFVFSMEGYAGYQEPRQEVAFAWAPGWNSSQAWNKFQDEVGGHLRAGDPGTRLFAPQPGEYDYCRDVPSAFAPRDGQWQAVALPHLFGSDETSARAEPIQARVEAPYVALAPADVERLQLNEGRSMTLSWEGGHLHLPLRIEPSLPAGLVGVPVGMGDMPVPGGQWLNVQAGTHRPGGETTS